MNIQYKTNEIPTKEDLILLYKSVGWGHYQCPKASYSAVKNSSFVVTAWSENELIGMGRAISDGTITVYFPDLLIKPNWQRKGIGTQIMQILFDKYGDFHNQVLIAEDEKARAFYKTVGLKEDKFAMSIMKPFPNE